MIKNIFIIKVLIMLITLIIKADTIYIKNDALLENKNFFENQTIYDIKDLNYPINGFLIIEINDIQDPNDVLANCKIYYIDKLQTIDDSDSYFLYNGFYRLLFGSHIFKSINDSIAREFNLIKLIYILLNEYNDKECTPFAYHRENSLNTDIFKNNPLYERNGKKYLIFKIKFRAIIYEYYIRESTEKCKTFVPITKLLYFKPAEYDELENNGFLKSKTFIKIY